MTHIPRLLNNNPKEALPSALFSDLQLDKILSPQSIAVLKYPCTQEEITHRNELFLLLDKRENVLQVENTLSSLRATEQAIQLLTDAKTPLDTYFRQAKLFESYLRSCEALISMRGFGELFTVVADFFSSEKRLQQLADIKKSVHKLRSLIREMSIGLLSVAEHRRLLPDCDITSEIDSFSECAENLGFSVPEKQTINAKINLSLSDAICCLYSDNVAQIEEEITKYSDVNFYEPISYISEIKFFLEMHQLKQRASKNNVSYCIAKVSPKPRYVARNLYDISLLAKNCENIIPNNADFSEKEPFYFLLGANGGGKTTYLRALGINLILFLAGCPVFATEAEMYPFDIVLSHFPKDERFDHSGRLDEERKRTEEMLNIAQNKAGFLFFNETFSGTDDKRGFDLLKETASKIETANHFGLYVTHFHEVMSLNYPVLSAEVDLSDSNKRTFRIVKSKGCASSFAADILKKYRLDKESLESRRCDYGN